MGFRRTVDEAGDLDLPLHVKLRVAGMTLPEVEYAISRRYLNCFDPSRQIIVSKGRQ